MQIQFELTEKTGPILHMCLFEMKDEQGKKVLSYCTTIHGSPYIQLHDGPYEGKAFIVSLEDLGNALNSTFFDPIDPRIEEIEDRVLALVKEYVKNSLFAEEKREIAKRVLSCINIKKLVELTNDLGPFVATQKEEEDPFPGMQQFQS